MVTIQKSTAPILTVAADFQEVTGGIPTYNEPQTYEVVLNGSTAAGHGSLSGQTSTGNVPWTTQINTNALDFPTTGTGLIVLFDTSGQLCGALPIQVVNFDPASGPVVGDPLANVPSDYAPGQIGANMNSPISAVIYLITTGHNPPGS